MRIFFLIDDLIKIPNGFIQLSANNVLICDSYSGEIWTFRFDNKNKFINKKLWAKLDGNFSPDGGCLVAEEFVFISLWDGAAIGVFDKTGVLVQKIELPVLRPTNCKYNNAEKELWITSASEGIITKQLKDYPKSGNTFCYSLEKKVNSI